MTRADPGRAPSVVELKDVVDPDMHELVEVELVLKHAEYFMLTAYPSPESAIVVPTGPLGGVIDREATLTVNSAEA